MCQENGKKSCVSIVGCGWLGVPLGRVFGSLGYEVKGSVREVAGFDGLSQVGIQPYQIDFPSVKFEGPDFWESEGVVIAVPFKRTLKEAWGFFECIEWCERMLRRYRPKWVLFCSSTSIYPQLDGLWHERMFFEPSTERAEVLEACEQLIISLQESVGIVVRLGGLVGPGRLPLRRRILECGGYTGLIHQVDAVGVCVALSRYSQRGVYNAVTPISVKKRHFYEAVARKYGLPLSEMKEVAPFSRIISMEKISNELDYTFIYPSPLDFIQ